MEIELERYCPQDYFTRQPRDGGQYLIVVDGRPIGYMPDHAGASPLLIERVGPVEAKLIERYIRQRLTPKRVGPLKMVGLNPTVTKPDARGPNDDFK